MASSSGATLAKPFPVDDIPTVEPTATSTPAATMDLSMYGLMLTTPTVRINNPSLPDEISHLHTTANAQRLEFDARVSDLTANIFDLDARTTDFTRRIQDLSTSRATSSPV